MSRKTVLLVDDEEPILFGLHRVLHKDNESIDVLIARTGEIAREILSSHSVDVLVTDVRMPGISGLELLCWTASKSPNTRAIIMTAFDTTGLESDAYRCGCLQIVQKPFDLHQMRTNVLSALDDSHAFRGSLTSLSPADVVQMLCLSRRTNVLRVVEDTDSGVVHIRHGEVVHAVWNELTGEEAFYQLVCAKNGIFDTLPLPDKGPVTIEAGWQHLLIEAMRIEDEERAGMSTATGAAATPKSTTKLKTPGSDQAGAPPKSTTQVKAATTSKPQTSGKSALTPKPKLAPSGKSALTPKPKPAPSGKSALTPKPIATPKPAPSAKPAPTAKPAGKSKPALAVKPIATPKPTTSGKIEAAPKPVGIPEPTTTGETATTATPTEPKTAAAATSEAAPDSAPPSSAWDAAVTAAKTQPVSKEDVPELIDKGFSLVQKRRYDEARVAWRAALEMDPGNRMLELNLRRLDAMKDRK